MQWVSNKGSLQEVGGESKGNSLSPPLKAKKSFKDSKHQWLGLPHVPPRVYTHIHTHTCTHTHKHTHITNTRCKYQVCGICHMVIFYSSGTKEACMCRVHVQPRTGVGNVAGSWYARLQKMFPPVLVNKSLSMSYRTAPTLRGVHVTCRGWPSTSHTEWCRGRSKCGAEYESEPRLPCSRANLRRQTFKECNESHNARRLGERRGPKDI